MASRFSAFLAELKRRKVGRVAAAYAAVGVAVIVAVPDVFAALLIPVWATRLVIVLILLGFPIALVLAWALEITPEGVRRTPGLTPEKIPTHTPAKWSQGPWILGGVGLVLVAGAAYFLFFRSTGVSSPAGRVGVAVIPFTDLSETNDGREFANGFHTDVITRLQKVSGLKVIDRQSVLEYRNTEKSTGQIGEELGVDAVLLADVQRAGNRVHINATLYRTDTEEVAWAEPYDEEYTLETRFSIQARLATGITEALQTTLLPEEARRLAELPTNDSLAYDLYLRSSELDGFVPAEMEQSVELLRAAIQLDPQFAKAYALLGRRFFQGVQSHDYPVAWADTVIALGERALDLDPDLPEGYHALTMGYHLKRQPEERNRADLRALTLNLGNAQSWQYAAWDAFDQGRCDRAYEMFLRDIELNPRIWDDRFDAALPALCLDMDAEARQLLEEAQGLDPDAEINQVAPILLDLKNGQMDSARALAEMWVQLGDRPTHAWDALGAVLMLGRDAPAAMVALDSMYHRAPDFHLNLREGAPAWTRSSLAWALLEVGEEERARELLQEARVVLGGALPEAPFSTEVYVELAAVHALSGEQAQALDLLDRALAAGGLRHPWFLRLDPRFDSVRPHPQFQDFLDRLQTHVDEMRRRVERGEVDLGIGD